MKKRLLLVPVMIGLFLFASSVRSQESKNNFFSNGKPIGLVFANFHTGLNQGNNPAGFEVRRAYLGYQFNLNKGFSTKIELDIGSPNDISSFSLLRRFAYFKNVYLQYAKGKFNFKFGIIPVQEFKLQEKIWGHRYIAKTILDGHKMAFTADLGASANYKVNDMVEIDLTVMNGEGYSRLQADESFKIGAGVTLHPWKGLVVRGYADGITKTVTQMLVVTFVGYRINEKMSAGVEYDMMDNFRFIDGYRRNAFSAYASWDFTEKFQLFARFDNIVSDVPEMEDDLPVFDQDGTGLIAGIQYTPIPKVKLALDYQDWYPDENTEQDHYAFLFLNLEFRIW